MSSAGRGTHGTTSKRSHALAVPPPDLAAAFRERLDRVLAHLHRELAGNGDVVLVRAMPPGRLEDPPAWDAYVAEQVEDHRTRRARGLVSGSAMAPADHWPAELSPLPLTAAGALDVVTVAAPSWPAELAAEVTRCAEDLVKPELCAAVLARAAVVNRWPLPDDAPAWKALHYLLAAVRDGAPGELTGRGLWRAEFWPGEAAALDVATWATPFFERHMNGSRADFLTWSAKEQGFVPGWNLTGEHGRQLRYPGAGLALLYLAEREVIEGQRRPAVAVDAGTVHHNLMIGWRDVPQDGKRHRAEAADLPVMDGRVELLVPGHAVQLALPLADLSVSESAIRLLRDTRGPKGLRHWTALQRLFSIEGGRLGWVRWTLNEHLAAMGYRKTSREDPVKRADAAAEVELLTRMELVVYDRANTVRHRAPLVMVGGRFERLGGSAWRLEGMELRVNDLLYRGVRNPDTGALGTNFWPAPVELAQIDHVRHPYAHGLGMLLAIRARWDAGDGRSATRLTGSTLLELAGIKYETRRASVAWEKLRRTLDELERIDQIGPVTWSDEPFTLDGICCLTPAPWIVDRTSRQLRGNESPPVDLPRSGGELRAWREARAWSQREAARRLGVAQPTLHAAEAQPDAALGPKVAAALARLAGGE